MCITKTESFEYAGKLYPSERQALEAAITDIGNRLVKHHAANPGAALMDSCSGLTPLLARFCEITKAATSTEVASKRNERGPKIKRSTLMAARDRVYSLARTGSSETKAFRLFMDEHGFKGIGEWLERATKTECNQATRFIRKEASEATPR